MQKNGNSSPIRVVVDAMGGDYGPQEPIKGALEALESENIEVILVGDQGLVEAELARHNVSGKPISIVPSVGKIGDDELVI